MSLTLFTLGLLSVSNCAFVQTVYSQENSHVVNVQQSNQTAHSIVRPREIYWHRDLRLAMRTAKTQNKLILINLYTDWCTWCKVLDQRVYANPAVVNYLDKEFICVKVNGEDPKLGDWVQRKYETDGFPVTVIINATGELMGHIDGYVPAEKFIYKVRSISGR